MPIKSTPLKSKQRAIPASLMRGGTSKGLYFAKEDLPLNIDQRDRVLLAAMGSPDIRQIDGVGGAHPLTSKVAIISKSDRADADIDYLFLQIVVDKAEVLTTQNCGNILAGVGPWAIENGLIPIAGDITTVRIHMVNSNALAVAYVPTKAGGVEYEGTTHIDGVPGQAAAIPIDFLNIAGSLCGALLPTGQAKTKIDGVEATCIDNGMPVILLRAEDFNLTGQEAPATLEANNRLKQDIETLRLQLGEQMNLGDVSTKTVPKMILISKPKAGGTIATRSFIPHRVHDAIGVLAAVSVATACMLPDSIAQPIAQMPPQKEDKTEQRLEIEHPTGSFLVDMDIQFENGKIDIKRAALLRTARTIMRGDVYIPATIWPK
ncbi:MAG: 4-oxalomesaconate tautomerase [Alphaproteobacteria bacterium]|nr:4-oxalomesaconate tautomerase [Alphaproteobacteria bacterium]